MNTTTLTRKTTKTVEVDEQVPVEHKYAVGDTIITPNGYEIVVDHIDWWGGYPCYWTKGGGMYGVKRVDNSPKWRLKTRFNIGDTIRHKNIGWQGTVTSIEWVNELGRSGWCYGFGGRPARIGDRISHYNDRYGSYYELVKPPKKVIYTVTVEMDDDSAARIGLMCALDKAAKEAPGRQNSLIDYEIVSG